MIGVSRDLQANLHVAIQGGPGSWSEESLRAVLPTVEPLRCRTFDDAWRAAHRGDAVAAWLPTTNSSTGEITETRSIRADSEVWLECDYPVRHALIGADGLVLSHVDRVEGHPRALEQCRTTLGRLVPRAKLVATVDGAHSARRLRPGVRTAVIGSPRIGDRPGLRVLRRGISDRPNNATTFRLLLRRENL